MPAPGDGHGDAYAACQLAGLNVLLRIARDQKPQAETRPFPRCPDGDQMAVLASEITMFLVAGSRG